MNIFKNILLIYILLTFSDLYAQKKPDDVTGIWNTEDNRASIEIFKKEKMYFGKIVKQKNPYDKYGNPKTDINNPDKNLRKRPLQNLVIIKNLKFVPEENKYYGTIYNVENGNTYKIYAKLIDYNTLKIRGYIGFSFIGKTTFWKRAKKR